MKSYCDNWVTGNDFVLACSVHGEEEKYTQNFRRRIRKEEPPGNPIRTYGSIIFKGMSEGMCDNAEWI
jgi:hypothetical protein